MFRSCLDFLVTPSRGRLPKCIRTSEVLLYDLALGVAPDKAIGCGNPIQDAYISQASLILVRYYLNVNCITCIEVDPVGSPTGRNFLWNI